MEPEGTDSYMFGGEGDEAKKRTKILEMSQRELIAILATRLYEMAVIDSTAGEMTFSIEDDGSIKLEITEEDNG